MFHWFYVSIYEAFDHAESEFYSGRIPKMCYTFSCVPCRAGIDRVRQFGEAKPNAKYHGYERPRFDLTP
jgi:hypothetical protein